MTFHRKGLQLQREFSLAGAETEEQACSGTTIKTGRKRGGEQSAQPRGAGGEEDGRGGKGDLPVTEGSGLQTAQRRSAESREI